MINEDNVIINTPEKELETEPQNIPQGETPFINPNPGYGEDGETKPAIKTVPFPGERGIRSEVVTPLKEGIKVERNLVNFLKGLLIKGKPLEEYIDSQGGVTEEELQAAIAGIPEAMELLVVDSDNFDKPLDEVFSEEQLLKLQQCKACLVFFNVEDGWLIYYPYQSSGNVQLFRFAGLVSNGIEGYYWLLNDYHDTMSEIYENEEEFVVQSGTKLYKHALSLSSGGNAYSVDLVNNSPTPLSFSNAYDFSTEIIKAIKASYNGKPIIENQVPAGPSKLYIYASSSGVITEYQKTDFSGTDTVTPL